MATKKPTWSFRFMAKIFGFVLLGVIGLTLVIGLLTFSYRLVSNTVNDRAPSYAKNLAYDMEEAVGMTSSYAPMAEMGGDYYYDDGLIMPPIQPGFTPGVDAESFEVKSYNGGIETRKLDEVCGQLFELKAKAYVIFENSDQNENNCYYRFKVEKEKESEIIALIESLDPDYFNENVRTIQQSVEGVESELDILQKRLASIEETLTQAQEAYDEISEVARRQQNAEALASVIDSKLNLIERLSRERLSTKSQIDQSNKQRQDLMDQLDFTFFDISVQKDVIFDWNQLKDNWKYEARELVTQLNEAIQYISLRLVSFIVYAALVIFYLFITIFLVKFVWMGAKKIWKGKKR